MLKHLLDKVKNEKVRAMMALTRCDRPIGSFLLLWPTLWALILAANGLPDVHLLLVFVIGVFLMRSAGCVINDIADRKVDGHVERTRLRPLPAGLITTKEAVALFIGLMFAAFLLVLSLNLQTIYLAFIGALLAFIYPFMKRWTQLPQVFLGLAFGWSIPMAWSAQTDSLPPVIWLLFGINMLWTIAYDTEYAMADRDDDLKIGIKSTAILFGRFDKLIIGVLQLSVVLLLIWLGTIFGLASIYYWSVLAVAALFVHQQYQIRRRGRQACFNAFLANNYVGMVITLGIAFSYIERAFLHWLQTF